MENIFKEIFGVKPEYKVGSFGRFEIIGNHTDHNGGCCVAAACNLGINGFCSKRLDSVIKVLSEGYNEVLVSLDSFQVVESEINTSAGLVRGVAKYLKDHGYEVGGFDLYTESNIFKGAGVSSSAAFEILIGQIFNSLFNNGKIDDLTLAKAGQFAENNYFGKNSGLLDQSSIAFSNISFLNFKSQENPIIETIQFPFNDVEVLLVNTGGSHAHLTNLYSNIPNKMKSAAKKIGFNKLIEGSLDLINKANDLDEEERNFATHFYNETLRASLLANALKNKDKQSFFNLINESRISSTNLLKNMQVGNDYNGSPNEACNIAMEIIKNNGACKINGGGFAGSIVCFVDKDILPILEKRMISLYSKENVSKISISEIKPYCNKLE